MDDAPLETTPEPRLGRVFNPGPAARQISEAPLVMLDVDATSDPVDLDSPLIGPLLASDRLILVEG